MAETKAKATAKEKSEQPASSGELSAQQFDRETKRILDAQPKVKVRLFQVAKDSSDKKLPDVSVAINGYVYVIPRGATHSVPEAVAEVLEHAGHI